MHDKLMLAIAKYTIFRYIQPIGLSINKIAPSSQAYYWCRDLVNTAVYNCRGEGFGGAIKKTSLPFPHTPAQCVFVAQILYVSEEPQERSPLETSK